MLKKDYYLNDFDYYLPQELIAQKPLGDRKSSRMLVLDKNKKTFFETSFKNLPDIISPEYLMVFNNTRVLKARLFVKKETGARIEIFLLKKNKRGWEVLAKPGKKLKVGQEAFLNKDYKIKVLEQLEDGVKLIKFTPEIKIEDINKFGKIPLPPYIKEELQNAERYQTVFSSRVNSSAAPTAGLHFDNEIFEKLSNKNIQKTFINLGIGLGTFKPLKEKKVSDNKLHTEEYYISKETVHKLHNHKKHNNGKVLAVGTTTVRTLETNIKKYGIIKEGEDKTNIFIYPGFKFKITDALLTNFHLPESSLLMMICAFAGYDFVMEAYKYAVKEKFRFFSFGDCMLII
ncbi:MAG: tRNA preQ1(34) S-adenosylmethionine ribosyltransferase-isomerase QueA [Candidatus Muiribacteriota bacterium]